MSLAHPGAHVVDHLFGLVGLQIGHVQDDQPGRPARDRSRFDEGQQSWVADEVSCGTDPPVFALFDARWGRGNWLRIRGLLEEPPDLV